MIEISTLDKTYTLSVEMDPVAKQRPRFNTYSKATYTPAKTKNAEKEIAIAYINKFGKTMLKGPLEMKVICEYQVPKSYTKKKKNLAKEGLLPKLTSPDVDNLSKTVLDALNKIAYEDDKQVISLLSTKRYAVDDRPRVLIEIKEVAYG